MNETLVLELICVILTENSSAVLNETQGLSGNMQTSGNGYRNNPMYAMTISSHGNKKPLIFLIENE